MSSVTLTQATLLIAEDRDARARPIARVTSRQREIPMRNDNKVSIKVKVFCWAASLMLIALTIGRFL